MPRVCYVECSYICLFRFDVVAGEDARAVSYRAVPPLSISLAHQDHISLFECQITGLWRLVGVQGHKFWKRKRIKHNNTAIGPRVVYIDKLTSIIVQLKESTNPE